MSTTSIPTITAELPRPKSRKLKRPLQKYPMVEVWWDDATNMTPGWMDNSELKVDAAMVLSVGFLVQETASYLIIASDTDADGHHNGRTQIPKGMMKRMRVLKQADQPKPTEAPAA